MSKQTKFFSIFLTVLLCALFSFSLFASETRVSTMGGVGFFVRDNSNIFYFPSTINAYSNQVITELRTYGSSNYTIGGHLPIGSATMGVYLNNPLLYEVSGQYVELNRGTTLLLGSKTGTMDFGFALTVALDSYTDEYVLGTKVEEETESAHYFGIGAGISNEKVDFGFRLDLPGGKWEEQNNEVKWGGYSVGVIGRTFMPQSDQLELVPVGAFFIGSSTTEEKISSQKEETKYGSMDIALGIGLNYHLNEKNLIVFGLEAFSYTKESEEDDAGNKLTDSEMTLPGIYLGLETQLNSWFIGRFGASQIYQTTTHTSDPKTGKETSDSYRDSLFGFSLGFGIKLGSFLLDASFNEGMLFDGPYVLSGKTNRLSNKVSLTYQF